MPVNVREAIRRIEGDGWELTRTRGSHRQYRHPNKPGLVTIAGKPSDTLHPKTWAQHHQTGRTRGPAMTARRYLIVIEGNQETNFSAYAPDLPGCVAAGETIEDVEREMHDAITFHLEGLRDAGEPIPEPSALTTAYVDVAA